MSWQVTVTAVRCDYVDDFASIMVYADETARCGYVNRHSGARDRKKRLDGCRWPDCPLVEDYRKQMLAL